MKGLFRTIKAAWLWLCKIIKAAWLWLCLRWLKIRLSYYVRWIRRACVRDQRIYHILLNPTTREVVVCDSNEYANIKRNLRKNNRVNAGQYIYATANPWEHTE